LQVEHADDREDAAFALNVLAQGRLAGKKVLGGIMAEDNHLGAALFFGSGPHAAFQKLDILRLSHSRCVALEDGVLNLVRAVLERDFANAQLKVLNKKTRVDGDNMGSGRIAMASS